MNSCYHYYDPLNNQELRPGIMLVRWKCKRCGRLYVFRTSTDWTNMKDDQGGRSYFNSEKGGKEWTTKG